MTRVQSLMVYKSSKGSKQDLCRFLALKPTWKAILNIPRFPSLATRGQQILMNVIVKENQKFSKFLVVLQMKGENIYNSNWAKRNRFCCWKKIWVFFFRFLPNAGGPLKLLTSNFFIFSKNKHQNWLSGMWQISKGTKSESLISVTLTLWKWQTNLW